ncbi:DUF1287 domain-containing protein [Dongia deserti]|uniref:DUF1287 domain-containing protein n=1 Tax=Dongia deserti TaxID=2268030 RepID=UPI000E64FF00|nr:DUF1287 domain-containing protein [Dongia deserti]
MHRLVVAVLFLLTQSANADESPSRDLLAAARAQVGVTLIYDPSYQRIAYPMGDVPLERGVCSDVVIRAFRAVGIDLQQELHRDMKRHFAAYPKSWGLSAPDPNIDHRRVPNLGTWFKRQGYALPVKQEPAAYQPGDIVTWTLANGRPHIGIVSDQRSADGARPLVIHNIGWGTREEDALFAYRITGHFRAF